MTAADISSIVLTVGFWQLVIDLLSNQMVFKKDSYQRSLRTMERFKGKVDRAENDLKKSEKHRKKFDRAKAEYQGACADVARRHFAPNILGSLFFIILLRILGIENQGKVSKHWVSLCDGSCCFNLLSLTTLDLFSFVGHGTPALCSPQFHFQGVGPWPRLEKCRRVGPERGDIDAPKAGF